MKTASRTELAMKTQGEIEAAVCEGVARFEQEHMGRGPKDIRAHLLDDLLVVRLHGVLTAAEPNAARGPRRGGACERERDFGVFACGGG
jgi:uncharacterized protein YbcI